MEITFKKFYESVEELEEYKKETPFEVAAQVANILCSYDLENPDKFYEMLQNLMGEFQPISNMLKQNIRDRMRQNGKYKFIGKSYFKGATPENDYTPSEPLTVTVLENDYSYPEKGLARLFVKCGGADNPRPISLRQLKDGKWMLWNDSIMSLLVDIKKPESENPWM